MATNQYPASEGLQVVPAQEGLQVVPAQPGLEVASNNGLEKDKAGDPAYQGLEVAPDKGLEGGAQSGPHKAAGTYCGLRKRTFAIIVGIILVVVIVAAVVGGVVGSKKSSNNNNSSPDNPAVTESPTKTGSPTATRPNPTATTTTGGPVPTTPLNINCPAINATSRSIKSSKSGTGYDFDLYCEANIAPTLDMGNINATSLNDCIQGCIDLIELGAPCVSVVWDSVFNTNLKHNCFLKKSTKGGLLFSDTYGTHPAAAVYQAKGGTYD
ncbi:hypothetical protein V493_08342 [Pseudogymnoascus sp. VKM F-4281 (FW-2241)]|nr:hypothetical protein V493_08342 [Pseudogymnoascus sp. VKM F-4281 (FW-2241)]